MTAHYFFIVIWGNCDVIAIKKGEEIDITPSANAVIESEDVLVVIGPTNNLGNLEEIIVKQK